MSDLNPSYGVPYMNKTRRSKNPMEIYYSMMARAFGVLAGTIFGLKFGDVAKLATKNKQLAAIAKLGKPSQQVSEVLTLAQVQKHLR